MVTAIMAAMRHGKRVCPPFKGAFHNLKQRELGMLASNVPMIRWEEGGVFRKRMSTMKVRCQKKQSRTEKESQGDDTEKRMRLGSERVARQPKLDILSKPGAMNVQTNDRIRGRCS